MNGKLSLTLRTIQIYANKNMKVDCRAKPDSPLSYVIFLASFCYLDKAAPKRSFVILIRAW